MAASILWRRLDTPGHDACRLAPLGSGWQLEGAAVFLDDRSATQLVYRVACDASWVTRHAEVSGWIGERRIAFEIRRDENGWSVNGEAAPGLDDCVDLDFAFTPATNLLQIRRAPLTMGTVVELPVAWFDPSAGVLDRLNQRYERRGPQSFWYQAPRFAYEALLETNADGFVSRYPGLWAEVAKDRTD